MDQKLGPYPSPAAKRQWAANSTSPMMAFQSGELTTNATGVPLGAANIGGNISDVWISVGRSGKDDSNTLSLTVDVKINGTTCLSTAPVIAHVSGEAATNKTTKNDSDTGVTVRALDADNISVSQGDIITYDMALTRTPSPTTEMANLAVVVEIEPV